MAGRAREVLAPMRERLQAAAREVDDAEAGLADARKRRNRLIRDAIDEGMSQRAVAAAVGKTSPFVVAVLGTPDDEDDE